MARFILPVKDLRLAKSRLTVPNRPALVEAMLLDTLEAVLAADVGPVVIVSPDPVVAATAQAYQVSLLHHHGSLNEAVSAALRDEVCAVVLPDLPALRPADVQALTEAGRGFVPDARGTGTTMAIARRLVPRFGPGSARSFTADGLPRLQASATARCDVDDARALDDALVLGVGPHTSVLLQAAPKDLMSGPR